MCGNNTPAFPKPYPHLALASLDCMVCELAGELHGDACEVAAKCNYVESVYGACEVRRRPSLAEGRDFLMSVEVFRNPKAQGVLRSPKHLNKRLGIIRYKSGLILRVEFGQFGDDCRIVYDHG